MSSKSRKESSRANGAKSRGPVTPEGKQKSSANSLSHGLLSKLVVLNDELPEMFAELLDSLLDEFKPQTPAQRLLVETMAAARWRLMRIWSIERTTMQTEIDKHDGGKYPPQARAAFAFRDLANQSRTLDLLTRYEVRFDRQFSRALNLLLKLQRPEDPESQLRQTTPSGAGLPACASAEGAAHPATEPELTLPELESPEPQQSVTSAEALPDMYAISSRVVGAASSVITSGASATGATEPPTQVSGLY